MGAFTLQRLLELKQHQEEAKGAELAEARAAETQARKAAEILQRQRQSARRFTDAGTKVLVGQLQNSARVVDQLDHRINAANEKVRDAARNARMRLTDFKQAIQDRRVFDRLKEKHEEKVAFEEAKEEQTMMDEIALMKFDKDNLAEGEK